MMWQIYRQCLINHFRIQNSDTTDLNSVYERRSALSSSSSLDERLLPSRLATWAASCRRLSSLYLEHKTCRVQYPYIHHLSNSFATTEWQNNCDWPHGPHTTVTAQPYIGNGTEPELTMHTVGNIRKWNWLWLAQRCESAYLASGLWSRSQSTFWSGRSWSREPGPGLRLRFRLRPKMMHMKNLLIGKFCSPNKMWSFFQH